VKWPTLLLTPEKNLPNTEMTLLLIYALCDALATCTHHGPEGGQRNCATPCRFKRGCCPLQKSKTEIIWNPGMLNIQSNGVRPVCKGGLWGRVF